MSLLDTASLIVTPNGYKEGKLYSVIPSDGSGDLSVTRATTATRVNSQGLVELVPYNLLTYSEDFSNAAWSKTALSVSTNSATAPNGLNTADTLTNTSGSAIVLQAASVNTSAIVTFSTYFKKTNNDWVAVNIARNGATTYGELYVWFNIATGAVGSNLPDGAAVLVDADIENVGNGWFRCSITGYVPNAVAYTGFLFFPDGNGSFNRVTSQSVYAWGAQLVEGSVAKDYQKTETRLNIPRLDYSNGTCPSILVEPQRTNLLTYSSSFDNAVWNREDISVTANAAISPSGIQDADKLVPNTNNNDHTIYEVVASGSSKTFSIYAKADGYNYVFIGANNYPSTDGVFFDLINGVVTTNTGGYTASITDEGDGWYRCSITSSNWPTIYAVICTSANGTSVVHTGNGTSGVLIWGAQLEAGSYATSYIPTTSASVTRNADVISKTGISSLIGQTEGTMYAEIDFKNLDKVPQQIMELHQDANNRFGLAAFWDGFLNQNRVQIYQFFGGNLEVNIQDTLTTGILKIACAYKQNDYVLYMNGQQIGVDTSASVPTTSILYLGSNGSTFFIGNGINSAALWKTRLTNAQLATLTTI